MVVHSMDCYAAPMKTKHIRLNLCAVIGLTTGIVLFYLLNMMLGAPLAWILSLFLSSIVATGWMAIRILKDPFTTHKTFDQHYYLDRTDLRRE